MVFLHVFMLNFAYVLDIFISLELFKNNFICMDVWPVFIFVYHLCAVLQSLEKGV